MTAPAKGVFVRETEHEGDAAKLREALGHVELDPDARRVELAR